MKDVMESAIINLEIGCILLKAVAKDYHFLISFYMEVRRYHKKKIRNAKARQFCKTRDEIQNNVEKLTILSVYFFT